MAQLKRYYPDKNRKDWFKWTIIKTGESVFNDDAILHKDMDGEPMYFDDKSQAEYVCDAINIVELEKVKEDYSKAIRTLKNVLHHNDATKDEFKLPKSLINEIKNVLS